MIRTLTLASAVLALSACSSTREIGTYGHDLSAANENFGAAVRHNIAAQTVNPNPADADVTVSAQRVAKAVDSYRNDTVEKPTSAGTMTIETQPAAPAGK